MSFTLTCYTLFDITASAVPSRHHPGPDEVMGEWLQKRNTQCNFDTILQAISLRSQPELTKYPEKIAIKFEDDMFGFMFQQVEDETYPCWTFEFDIMHTNVFNNGISELGLLFSDCDNIPMIKCGTEWDKLPAFLDTTDELRNIYFKVKDDQTTV